MNILQELYDSEINCRIETFWDAGFAVKLGDEMNGFIWDGEFRSLAAALEALTEAACDAYPDSAFAKNRKAGTAE